MSFLALLALLLSLRIAISDLYARRVPNAWLLAGAGGAALGLLGMQLAGRPAEVSDHLLGAAAGLVALLPFHLIGWMGAGDVKYFAVLGLLLGLHALLPVWLGASALAGAHVLCVVGLPRLRALLPLPLQQLQARAAQQWRQHPALVQMQRARQGRVGIPFAAYLAFATLAWVLWPAAGAGV
ncbi:A24 family peptidase [Stenotrophomonas sp. 278]|uniref:prepilin peptidase n=1 Tax=Stenotrophomonas sp. 278 TaxID=2479851 RepID=UPI000F6845D6|nr:A24 family peptidase [Stenotrophomonas sp. 278]RRU05297.1 prepilin peptidase [Stenotrophomonas sp. 278]